MSWNVVELDFGGEETANFGTRHESGTALFQLHTAATISHSEPEMVKKPPYVTACNTASGLCIASDNQASIFDENCQKQNASFSFESTIELASWVDDLPLLILAERNGTVHFIHATLNQAFLSQSLFPAVQDNCGSTCFRQICITKDAQGKYILLLLASPGILFTFSNLDLLKLDEVIQNGDFATAKDLQGQICMEKTDVSGVHDDGAMGMTTVSIGERVHIVTCGGGESILAVWESGAKTELKRKVKPIKYISGKITKCIAVTKYIFTLDEEYQLSLWNMTPLLLSVWAINVRDFSVAGSEMTGDGRPQFQLVMLNTPNKNGSFLKVYDLPSMQCTYTLAVGPVSMLSSAPSQQDSLYFVEGGSEYECKGSAVTMLMVRCLTEALPETRFHRLLHKKQFGEAEKFATLFNLDLELVHRSKATALLDQASTWSLESQGEAQGDLKTNNLCDELIACLDRIGDVNFVVGVCINATMARLEDTMRVLQYARGRLFKTIGKEDTDCQSQQLLTLIVAALHRLATFDRVYGSCNYSASSWESFLNGDLLEELLLHLSHAHLPRASVIWNRHRKEFEKQMSEDLLERLLRAVPGDAPSCSLIPWLREDIIPFVCRCFQRGKKLLISWIEERVVSLEVTEKGEWPNNGLELAKLLVTGNQQPAAAASWGANCARALTENQTSASDCKEALERLKELVRCLHELQKLHTKYKCFLTLDQFRMETSVSICLRMLERVGALELVSGAVGGCVAPYAREKGLEVGEVLLRYVEGLLSSGTLHAGYEAFWEAKAIHVISCIADMECRCRAIYALMQKAPVPWSRDMEQVVQEGLRLDHPLVALLQERFRLIELRNIFLKYDLRSVTLDDPQIMKIVLWNILSREGDGVLADALQVLKALRDQLSKSDVYLFRLRHLIRINQIDKSLELLVSLPAQESVACLTRLLSWMDIILSDPPDCFPDDESKDQRLLVGQAALRFMDLELCKDLHEDEVTLSLGEEKGHQIDCILHLQMEYDLIIPLGSYQSKAFRLRLLKKFVVEHFRETTTGVRQKVKRGVGEKKDRELKPGNFIRVQRVGELLGVSASELQGQVALKATETGEIATAIEMCRDLSEVGCSPGVTHTIYQVCHTIATQWLDRPESARSSSGGDLVADVLQLVQRATAFCAADLLVDCFDLCTKLHSLAAISSRCESGDYGISLQMGVVETQKDPYQEYTFESFFKEDAMVLDAQSAIPLAANFILSCHPRPRPSTALPYQQARVAGEQVPFTDEAIDEDHADVSRTSPIVQVGSTTNDLYQTLRESSQCELAFHCLMQSLATSLVHLSLNQSKRPAQQQVISQAVEQDVQKMIVHVSRKTLAELSSMLLNKIFSCRHVDCFLALCFLSVLPKKLAKEQIKKLVHNAGQNYKKIMAIARVGCELAKLNEEPQLQDLFHDLHTNASWGGRLLELKISFKEALNNAEKRSLLLPEIIAHPETSLQLITEYCRDFHLDEQEALMTYVRLLLLPSDTVPKSGDEGMSSEALNPRFILPAVGMIQKRGALVNMLLDSIDKIDCYDYERLRLVLEIIHSSNLDMEDQTHSTEVGLKLLDYLDAYTRTKPPTDYEVTFHQSQEEQGLMLTAKTLPPLSKTRLPFHPLLRGGQWKILSRELSEETLGQLLPIAEVLKLSIDQLYVITIQNIIKACQQRASNASGQGGAGGGDEKLVQVSLRQIDLGTLARVQDLLLRVQHLQMAVVTARFIAKELPVSKEKVMALKICEGLAHRWREVSQEGTVEHQKACATYDQLVSEHRAGSTEESLRRHGLARPPYTQLIATPAKLIFTLYEDDSIVQRIQDPQQDYPDINVAAEEIAKINNCNMDKIRLRLTNQWLPQPASARQEETTMSFSFDLLEREEIPEEERSLMRLKYLLQQENGEILVKFLLNVAFQQSAMTGSQVRALRCLFSIADEALIETVSKRSVAELREYLKSLVYLGEFEALSIAMDLPTFTASNKASLVRGLWHNHSHEPRSVQLICNLCLEYCIYDKHLWNSILLQLQKFGMLDYLGYVLVQLAGMEELRWVQCLSTVWSVVLSAPFSSVCIPLSEQQVQKCRSVLSLLLRCPVLFDLDLVRLSCQFVRVEMYAEALACLLNMPDKSKRDVQVRTLLQNRHREVLEALEELKANHQPLPGHEQVVAEVKKHLQS